MNYVYRPERYVFNTMVAGSYFGEIEVINQTVREFTVVTECYCEMIVMGSDIFDTLEKEYPNEHKMMADAAVER